MKNTKTFFTICTPTYNRAHTLEKLYVGLQKQKFKDFEWLIIDDGSVDKTMELINKFKSNNDMNIRYYFKRNEGKHRAINYGIKRAKGEFFFIIDSDDYCDENSLNIIYNESNKFPNYNMIISLDQDLNGNIIGDKFPKKINIANFNTLTFYNNVKGDKWIGVRTKVIRQFPFPEFEGEKFIPESSVWQKISKEYDAILINKPLLIVEYQQDGLSNNTIKLRKNNPLGIRYVYLNQLKLNIPLKYKIKACINLYRFSFSKIKIFLSNIFYINIFYSILSLPIALIFFINDWRKK